MCLVGIMRESTHFDVPFRGNDSREDMGTASRSADENSNRISHWLSDTLPCLTPSTAKRNSLCKLAHCSALEQLVMRVVQEYNTHLGGQDPIVCISSNFLGKFRLSQSEVPRGLSPACAASQGRRAPQSHLNTFGRKTYCITADVVVPFAGLFGHPCGVVRMATVYSDPEVEAVRGPPKM